VDSSKSIPWFIDSNLRGYKTKTYQTYNILLYKKPVALFYSLWKRGDKDLNTTLNVFYNDFSDFFKSKLPYVSVNYDLFVSKPDEMLKKLCGILDIPYFKRKIFFWEKTHHHLFGSFGTRKQLFEAKPSIYNEQYSEEYQKLMPEINEKVQANKKINSILDRLSAYDIESVEKYPSSFEKLSVHKDYESYYKTKIKKYFKRFSPVHYLDYESNFIREYKF
jgi:hypothetical protein